MASRTNRVLTDHDEIRRWAEQRDASPACVRGTGGKSDIGMLRLDFPGYSGAQSLNHIQWNDWFDKFDERGLALLVQDRTARGERSNFNKIVSRETAGAASRGRASSRASATRKRTTRTAKPARAKSKSSAKRTTARTSRTASSSRRSRPARKAAAASTRSTSASRANTASRTKAKTTRSAAARSNSRTRPKRSSATTGGRSSNRNNVRTIESGRRSSTSHVLTDHDEIRRWAEQRKAAPACVRGTGAGKDPGMIRLDFPGFSGSRSLEHIDWDEWFRAFDENNLALLVQDTRAGGGRSNFNKLIGRETAARRSRGDNRSSRRHPEKAASSRTRANSSNVATKKETRGSTRSHRTESARGRNTSQRRAA